jgi:hypothetical protein
VVVQRPLGLIDDALLPPRALRQPRHLGLGVRRGEISATGAVGAGGAVRGTSTCFRGRRWVANNACLDVGIS